MLSASSMRHRLTILIAVCTLFAGPALAQKADIAERTAINPGLGPCPGQVLRDTPADAWRSFMRLGAAREFALAAHLLDLTEVPVDEQSDVGAGVAERFYGVLTTLGAAPDAVNAGSAEGPVFEEQPQNVVVAFRFVHARASGEAWLRRTRDQTTGQLVWLFTRQTVSSIPLWYRAIVEGDEAGQEEPFNAGLGDVPASVLRGDPRVTVAGFLSHAKRGSFLSAAHYLDLDAFAPADQPGAGRRLARRLFLALMRSAWVNADELSNDEYGAPERGIHEDEETIARGPLNGEMVTLTLKHRFDPALGSVWTFSQETVARINDLYRHHGYGWIGDHLPEVFFSAEFAGLQLWQWAGLVVVLAAGWMLARIISTMLLKLFGAVASRSSVRWDDAMVQALNGPLGVMCWGMLVALASPLVGTSDVAQGVIGRGWRVITLVGFGWILFRSVDLMALQIRSAAARADALGLSFVPVVSRIVKILLFVFVLLAALDVIGLEVVGLLAGLGLGGLAVAFAAQKTLENLFGAIAIAADQPFKIGDWVTINDTSGTVEDVGLRSTRLRTLERTLVSIPNGVVTGAAITNFGARDRILYRTIISLSYGSTREQLQYVVDEIKRMLLAHSMVFPDNIRVRFLEFGQSSLNIEVLYWVLTADYHVYTGVAEELNFRTIEIVERSGSSFAFPTRTIHFSRARVVDAARQEAVRAEVERRRQNGELSIPEPPEELRQRLRDGGPFSS